MIDAEVERLRRLRAVALRVRAVAWRLGADPATHDDRLFTLSACAAWRVVRLVSGHLRAHPYASFQQDAGVGTLLVNGLSAQFASLGVSSHVQAIAECATRLKALSHELDDARSLTRMAELSESFGRSQIEIRALIDAMESEATGLAPRMMRPLLPQSRGAAALRPRREGRASGVTVATAAAAPGGDWPYLGL